MAIQDLAGNYGLLPEYVQMPTILNDGSTVTEIPGARLGGQGFRPEPTAPLGLEVPPAEPAAAPSAPPPAGLTDMTLKYAGTSFAPELRTAASKVDLEQKAFDKLIKDSLAQPSEKPSQAELYFRLAAAFGTPTKTGSFFESLGLAGKELSEYFKENRATESAARANRLKTLLESRKLSLQAARDELSALRTLAVEEIKSLGPQSQAGKQAQDEGLKPGTPEFQKRVNEIAQTSVDARLAQINATLAGLKLRETESKKLTPGEVKLKSETEDSLAGTQSAMGMLKQAYALNPNTFDNSLADLAQRKVLEAAGSKDPKLLATRELENLLSQQALEKLKPIFGGMPTEGERKILLDLQGIGAKSVEERKVILMNAYRALQAHEKRQSRRLQDINAGLYRATGEQTPGGPD